MDFVIKFHSRHGFSEGCTSIPGVANPLTIVENLYRICLKLSFLFDHRTLVR